MGVIDSGIANHPDLERNLAEGWDFCKESDITDDDQTGHGTTVAGIIGAVGGDGSGIAGGAWNVTLIPLQITEYTDFSEREDEIQTITYATEHDITILNFSRGGSEYDAALLQAIANYPGPFVCAAGNDGKNIDTEPCYPSSYKCENLISVANCTSTGARYIGDKPSNYGGNTVHLAAPGTNIISTTLNGEYETNSATSWAAPLVTGVAALIYSIRPDLTPAEVKNIILSNVDLDDHWTGLSITGGILNAHKAVRAATEPQTFMGDVNGDGKSDMILSRNVGGKRAFTVYCGLANGKFKEPVTTLSTRNFFYTDPAFIGDFNGDGKTDIMIHWSNGNKRQLLVYISQGNGYFNEGVNLSSTRNHFPDIIPTKFFVADVDNDNKDDFVVHYRNTSGKRCALVYRGSSTSPYFIDAATDAIVSTNTYYHNDPVYMGDFNGDGCADMLVQWIGNDYKRQLLVYKGNPNGTFSTGVNLASTRYHKMGAYPAKFVIADVEGDGKDDFIVHWKNGSGKRCNLVYKGKSASPYLTDATTDALVSTNNYVIDDPVFVGDINGDGTSDMVVHWVSNGKRQLLIYTANTDCTYDAAIRCPTTDTHDPTSNAGAFYIADVNSDGRDDFIVKWRDGLNIRLLTYLGMASGSFREALTTTPTTNIPYYNAS